MFTCRKHSGNLKFRMLDISSIQYNAENPTLVTVIYTMVCAVSLGIVIAFTYINTTHAETRHNHFVQALVLVTVVAAMIIQAIGDSVARGLGMLGALSIIRFRTTVRDPRNIVFIFGAIGAGIACGVFGFLIAMSGTFALCITAFLLKYVSANPTEVLRGTFEVEIGPQSNISRKEIETYLQRYTSSYKLGRHRYIAEGKKAQTNAYRYSFTLAAGVALADLCLAFSADETVRVSAIQLDARTLQDL